MAKYNLYEADVVTGKTEKIDTKGTLEEARKIAKKKAKLWTNNNRVEQIKRNDNEELWIGDADFGILIRKSINLTGLTKDGNRYRMSEGSLKGKTAFRCPECSRGLMVSSKGNLVCGEHGRIPGDIVREEPIDLRKIGKDKKITEWAKREYKAFLEEAQDEGFKTVKAYVDSMPKTGKESYREYLKLGVGLEKMFKRKG